MANLASLATPVNHCSGSRQFRS